MTLLDFLSSLAWAAVILLIAEKLVRLGIEYIAYLLTHSAASIERDLAVARINVPEPKKNPLPSRSEIQLPDDLEAYVNSWNDEWAKDDNRNYLQIKYLELHTGNADETWQRVRRAVGIGELP